MSNPDVKNPKNYKAKTELLPLSSIIEYPGNARTHPEDQIKKLEDSIQRHGFLNPILISDQNVIIAGHGRYRAAVRLKIKTVPVIRASHLSEKDARAYRLIDNQLALLSAWDAQLIQGEIASLKSAGFDIPLLGFPEAQLRGWGISAGTDSDNDPEVVPEPPKNPVVRKGDLWILGEHRLLCGDARINDDIKKLLNGVTPDLANCDPPYGIGIVKGARSSDGGAKPFGSIGGKPLATDRKHISNYGLGRVHAPGQDGFSRGRVHGPARRAIIAPGLYEAIIGDDTTETAISAYQTLVGIKVPIICLWGGNYYADALPPSRCWLVWDKETTGTFADAELAWTNQDRVTKLFRHQWNGLMKASERGERRVHPTQKPVALGEWVIDTIAPEAKTVIDLFVGSGSALIGCERKGLKFFGMELAPTYVQCSIERWQTFTGRKAMLNGKTLEQVAKARGTGRPRGGDEAPPKAAVSPSRGSARGRNAKGVATATPPASRASEAR